MASSLFVVAGRYAAGDGEVPTVYSGKRFGAARRCGCSEPQSKSNEMEVECEEKNGKGKSNVHRQLSDPAPAGLEGVPPAKKRVQQMGEGHREGRG